MAAKPWVVVDLVLPVGDKEYTIRPVNYADGLRLRDTGSGENGALGPDADDAALFQLVMGDAWDAMNADGQPYNVVFRAGTAAMQFQFAVVAGRDTAAAVELGEKTWEEGLDPEAVAAAMAANPSPTSRRSTSTASARKTPSRASTKTTTSPKGTRRTGSTKAAPRSSGKPSSASGR